MQRSRHWDFCITNKSGWRACSATGIEQWRSFLSSQKKCTSSMRPLFYFLHFTIYNLNFTLFSQSIVLCHPLRLGPQFDMLPNNIWRHTVWCRIHETFPGLPQAAPCLALMTVWYVTCRKILVSLNAEGLHARGVLRGGERSEVHIKFCHKGWRKEMALNI
jgi:hypothetical protein